jgi:hypothetical protein
VEEIMSTEGDRRAPGASRIPFEALVEVGGASGPSFEAQAVNISQDGMQLRTAYLPEAGQPLTCRFEAGPGESVLASGEVVWAKQAGKGGEFAIRFVDLDAESAEALRRMCGVEGNAPAATPGAKVRLHIDGLNSPMRARVKGTQRAEVTVGSDLGFLQVGKQLDLEDAESGSKRPARIDGVAVDVDPDSRVPQLVVTLRYADAQGDIEAARGAEPEVEESEEPEEAAPAQPRVSHADDLESVKRASGEVKGALARGAAKVGPAIAGFAQKAKTAFASLAAKTTNREASPPRRTTAPAPGGGLHASGRRVIRGEKTEEQEETTMTPKFRVTKRKVAIGGAVVLAAVLGVIALKKPSAPPAMANPTETSQTQAKHPPVAQAPKPVEPPPAIAQVPNTPPPGAGPVPVDDNTPSKDKPKGKPVKVTPFVHGAVGHGNVLTIKMDGMIEKIQGAAQPTGFTVHIPGRKSVEAAAPLASKDPRIAAVKVTNDANGAELTMSFKDGVPHYQVRAKGDTLEIVLAQPGKTADKKVAKKGDKAPKKKGHDKGPDKH